MTDCYLDTGDERSCFGCEACVQACPTGAMEMFEDAEGFCYPRIDEGACIGCRKCRRVCPHAAMPPFNLGPKRAWGGHIADNDILQDSTSGGVFTALARTWIELTGGVVFGAEAHGLEVAHGWTDTAEGLARFRKSKYAQSRMGDSYARARAFLKDGKPVLFSGTPCQVAGLLAFLGEARPRGLATVEVVCEGIPSPHYIRRYAEHLETQAGQAVVELDYRCKDGAKWDFQVMEATFADGSRKRQDRWFNPFWNVWLRHLMSRPSCYACPFAKADRLADVTLGDLWGVHLYCPELYNGNAGASLAVCSTQLGRDLLDASMESLCGHELAFEDALRYQSPMRQCIGGNPQRQAFLADAAHMEYGELNRKWAQPPDARLLASKYLWGNRQKVAWWNFRQNLGRGPR